MKISDAFFCAAVISLTFGVTGCSVASSQPGSANASMHTIAISTIVEVPPLLETRDGVIKALADRGFVEGKNLAIKYQSAGGNMQTQQEIAKKFSGDGPSAIIAISTPTAQTMLAATKEIPIIFAAVTDPVKAKLITRFGKPITNITGVSDAAPLELQLQLFKELMPNLKRIGYLYNPQLPSPVSTLESLRKVVEPLGITVIESTAITTSDVLPAAGNLLGKVDAIYLPNDTTINPVLESIFKIGRDTKTPMFTGETSGVERGAVASLGLSYFEIGLIAGNMVADVLSGTQLSDIDAILAHQRLTNFKLVVNKGAAAAMGVRVPDSVIRRATKTID